LALWTVAALCLFTLLSSFVLFGLDIYGSSRANVHEEENGGCLKLSDITNLRPNYYLLVFIVACYFGTLYVFWSNASKLLRVRYGYDEIESDFYFSIMTMVAAFLAPICGAFMDKFGLRGIAMSIGLLLMIIGFLGLVYFPYPVLWIVIAGIGDSINANCCFSLLALVVPEDKYATGYGFMSALYNLAQTVLFGIVGLMSTNKQSKRNLEQSFTLLGGLLCCGFIVSIIFNLYDWKRNHSICNLPTEKYDLSAKSLQEITVDRSNVKNIRDRAISTTV